MNIPLTFEGEKDHPQFLEPHAGGMRTTRFQRGFCYRVAILPSCSLGLGCKWSSTLNVLKFTGKTRIFVWDIRFPPPPWRLSAGMTTSLCPPQSWNVPNRWQQCQISCLSIILMMMPLVYILFTVTNCQTGSLSFKSLLVGLSQKNTLFGAGGRDIP